MSTTAFLYEKYMNPKWGERIPRGQETASMGAWNWLGGGTKLRAISRSHRSRAEASRRYGFAVERDYDAVSQVQAMDMEGLDVGVLFRTSPLHCDDSFEAEYANDLCRAWNSWITDFAKRIQVGSRLQR